MESKTDMLTSLPKDVRGGIAGILLAIYRYALTVGVEEAERMMLNVLDENEDKEFWLLHSPEMARRYEAYKHTV